MEVYSPYDSLTPAELTARLISEHDGSAPVRSKRRMRAAGSLLTVEQAAGVVGLSAKWVYRNYKRLPHVLLGSGTKPRIRFRREALEQWVRSREIDWRTR